ncbi:glycosyl hydrolase family 25, partial [Bifidobacterium myosotis]
GIDLYAGYKNGARFTPITLDPNYSGADKISVKIYAGKKIGEQLPTVTRDGYTLTGWYTDPVTNVASQLDTDKKATTNPDYPAAGSIWYARWTADSKDNSQLNGLLNNLSRFYVVKNDAGKYVVSDGSNANFVKTKVVKVDGKDTFATTGADLAYTEYNPGYVKTSYDKFVAARKSVLTDLKKELKLANNADINTVYAAVKGELSAEKADTYNRKLANILVGEADFPDVNTSDTDSHTDSIQFMYNQGIVKGYADGTFGYGAPVARVDFIVWLYRAAGSPAVDSQASFTDVTAATVPNQEFRDAIAWAAANKITTGYADGTFAPYARIARQDAAAFIYRAAGSPNYIEDYNSKVFADVTPGDSANHSKAVLWANNNGVVKGFAGSVNRFAGLDTVARQDAAAFLARAIQANLL